MGEKKSNVDKGTLKATRNELKPQGAGMKVKFDFRGQTYTFKDFQGMTDHELYGKVVFFIAYLPWKDRQSQDDMLSAVGMVGRWIKERKKKTKA